MPKTPAVEVRRKKEREGEPESSPWRKRRRIRRSIWGERRGKKESVKIEENRGQLGGECVRSKRDGKTKRNGRREGGEEEEVDDD